MRGPTISTSSQANISRMAALGLTFVFNLTVARILGAEGAGVFMTSLLVVTLVGMLGRVGTDLYALRFALADGSSHSDHLPYGRLTRICLFSCAGFAFVSMAVGAGIYLGLQSTQQSLPTYLALCLSVPAQGVAILDSAVLRSRGRPALGTFFEVGLPQALALLGVSVLALTSTTVTSFRLAVLFAASSLACAAMARGVTLRTIRGTLSAPASPPLGELVALVSGSALSYVWSWLPAIAVWIALGPAEAAIVIVAMRLSTLLPLAQVVLINGMLPQIASRFAVADIRGVNAALRSSNRLSLVFVLPVAAAMLVFAPTLMTSFGADFVEGDRTLVLLVIGAAIMSTHGLVLPSLAVIGQARLGAICAAAAIVIAAPTVVWIANLSGRDAGVCAAVLFSVTLPAAIAQIVRRRTGIIARLA